MKRLLWAGPLVLAVLLGIWYLTLPWPLTLRTEDPERTALMQQRIDEASERGETLRIQQSWVPLGRISAELRRAVILAEDARFREHNGIDWRALAEEVRYTGDDAFSWTDRADLVALARAVRYYAAHRDEIRGRSGITQQLAKNLYFSTERSLVRKVEELVVARRIERFLEKDRILELYLNIVELGPGIFGVEAAARHYYGRSAADLTTRQAAALAATLPHPLTSNPGYRPERMRRRQQALLQRLNATRPTPRR